jgi:N-acetyl-gamma-glutamyl-phosphate reductase
LLARHPAAVVTLAMGSNTAAGDRKVAALKRIWDAPVKAFNLDELADGSDAVFLAVPDTLAAEIAPALVARGARVFDLSGAFRLRDREDRQRWYPHAAAADTPAAYGLTEVNRALVEGARLVACPGCYPTAALLALKPLAGAGLIEPGVIIDAKSGVSGAGKTPTERTHFSECHGSISAYGVFSHRHGAEIEQELGVPVTFVPHLVPLDRGIFETIYARLKPGIDGERVAAVYEAAYSTSPFVRLTGGDLPEIKHVAHTNFCDIGWKVDRPGGQLVVAACIDNLVKGAAGQAIQNFNVAYGFDEKTALWN